jgi:hypothetical protein
MEPIKFILGEETRPKIETFCDIESSLFKDQYEKAFEEIVEYIEITAFEQQTTKNSENRNNIFAFIGERGSGKTSCMLSVSDMLLDSNKKFHETFSNNKKIECLDSKYFFTIDLVDPSFFDQRHNILDIVIAKLFKSFDHDVKKKNLTIQSDYLIKKQNLINDFQETKENLNQMLSNEITSDDSIEQLIGLAAGVNLKESMNKLINSYLDYFSISKQAENKKVNHLIIKIDDIDLHTQHAYIMVEQIRKYLIQPNVIVLIAAKIDQLSNVIRLHYTVEFDKLISSNVLSESYIEEMVDKYLGKILPLSNRIFLPETTVYINRPLQIFTSSVSNKPISFNSVREAVPTLIFYKTRFLFYNSKGANSYIIPRNLRDLRNLVKLLFNMNNYRIQVRPEYNKIIFKEYLFKTWTINNLDKEGNRIVENILAANDAIKLNKTVIKSLKEHFSKITETIEEQKTSNELSYILKDENQTFNTSCGDLIVFISLLESLITNEVDHKLLFIIKTFYSIKLYEYYDEITEDQLIENSNIENQDEVFKNEFMNDYSNYEKLVAGNFINSAFFDIITTQIGGISRSQRNIDGSIIFSIISQLKTEQETIQIKNILLNKTDALKIVEFFALTTSRKYDSKDKSGSDNTDKLYRVKREVYYGEYLYEQNKNIYFDIMSIFYNITNIKRAYNRFTPEDSPFLFEMSNNNSNSLYSQLKKAVCEREGIDENDIKEIQKRLLSWFYIRNIEVLETFITELQQNKTKSRGDDKYILKRFLNSASEFKILSYDFDESNIKHYNIEFSFLKTFYKILDEMNPEVFTMIFSTFTEKKEKQISNLKVSLGLQNRGKYSKDQIWQKLKFKNQQITSFDELEKLFYSIFISPKFYNQKDANSLLKILKEKHNGQS